MNFKKITVTMLVILMCITNVFAWQKTFNDTDEEFKTLMLLKNLSGVDFPEVTTPVSGSQMLNLLNQIDQSDFDEFALDLYENLKEELSYPPVLFKVDNVGIDARASVTPFEAFGYVGDEVRSHALTNQSTSFDDNWFRKWEDRYDLFAVDADVYITEHFFGTIRASNAKKKGNEDTFADNHIHYDTIVRMKGNSQVWPYHAYASVGGDVLNFVLGRDRLSAGNGVTGNMSLSSNRYYDDYLKLSITKAPLSYDFTAIAFDGFLNMTDEDWASGNFKIGVTDFDGPRKYAIFHRFSSTIAHRLTLSAYEGAVVYGTNSISDLRALNPFMFIHNIGSYKTGNTNNFFGIEAGFAISKGLSVNGQLLVDQFQLKSESDESGKTQIGGLLNVKGTFDFKKGLLSWYAEGVYASEGLYLKENTNSFHNANDNTYRYAMVDLVSCTRHVPSEGYEFKYLGYPDGGDLLKFALGAKYIIKDHSFAIDAAFLLKGPYGIGTNEQRILDDSAKEGCSAKQKSLLLGLTAKGKFLRGIDYTSTLAYSFYFDYEHVSGRKHHNLQFSIGCKIDPTLIFVKRQSLSN